MDCSSYRLTTHRWWRGRAREGSGDTDYGCREVPVSEGPIMLPARTSAAIGAAAANQ